MALARNQREYWEGSLECFMETWLHQDIPNNNVSIKSDETVWADRAGSGKGKGGGLA